MPTKKKYNARFPPARIKKIIQTDEDIGKVAAPVPVILSKALEIFMQSLLETACKNTQARHAKTMSSAHLYHSRLWLKQCITSESQFDFLKELVENIPDLPTNEEEVDDVDEPKPKRRKTTAPRKVPRKERKRKEKEPESESDEETQSEEEDCSNSTESGSNAGLPSNTFSDASNSSSSFAKPTEQNDFVVLPNNRSQASSSSLQIPNNNIPVPSLYRPVHSEDDDYDS